MKDLKSFKFADVYSMSSGISSKPEQAGHGPPFASFSTIFNNYFLPDRLTEMMDSSEEQQKLYSIKKGDVFLTRTSETLDELGMSSVALKDYPKATYSGFVKRLRPKVTGIVDEKFIGFYLRSKFFRKAMTNNAIMTLRASLNEEIFSYLKLLLPDYENQTRIGNLLFLLNSKIDLNNQINIQLETFAKALFDFWFVQFDFPDKNGRPYKTSGGEMIWSEKLKRAIPKTWTERQLDFFGGFKNGINYDPSVKGDTKARIINVRNISKSTWFVSPYDLDEIDLQSKDIKNYLVTENDILIARSGIPGATRLICDFEQNTIYCGFIIRYQVQHLNYKNYLFFCLKNLERASTSKSAGTIMQNINQETLKGLAIVQPDEETILTFNKFVSPIISRIILNNKESNHLETLRNWLVPLLMNGQVEVG